MATHRRWSSRQIVSIVSRFTPLQRMPKQATSVDRYCRLDGYSLAMRRIMTPRTLVGAVVVAVSILVTPKPSEACSCIDVQRTAEQRVEDFRAEYHRAIAVFV